MQGESTISRNNHSSLPLQMLIYFSFHYTPFFFLVNLALYAYKAVRYFYPARILGWELTTIFLFIFIDGTRLLLASKGNKTSTSQPLIGSIILAIPMLVLHSYYLALQTYILRVDLVLNAIAIFFLGLELLLSVLVLANVIMAARRF